MLSCGVGVFPRGVIGADCKLYLHIVLLRNTCGELRAPAQFSLVLGEREQHVLSCCLIGQHSELGKLLIKKVEFINKHCLVMNHISCII